MSMSAAVRPGLAGGPIGLGLIGLIAIALGAAIVGLGVLAVLGLFGVFAFMTFMRFPVLGLYVTTVLLLLQGSTGVLGLVNEEAPVAITLAQISGLAALAAWAVSALVRKLPVHYNGAVILIVMYVLWALFTSIISAYTDIELPHWLRLATRLAFFLLAINVLNTPNRLRTYVILILVCTFVMCFVAVVQYFTPAMQVAGATAWATASGTDAAFIDQESLQGEAAIRVSGRAGHSNWLAMIILLVLPLYMFWLTETKYQRVKAFIYVALVFSVIALILTYTRTGFLIGIVLALLLLSKRLMHFSPLRVFAAMLFLVIAFALAPDAYKERVLSPAQYKSSQSINSRLALQDAAWDYWTENPIFGLGIGGFGSEFIRENNPTASVMRFMVYIGNWEEVFIGTHNMYLQLLADTGIIGFILFAWFYWLMFRGIMRYEQHYREQGDREGEALASALWVSLLGFAICCVFLHALQQHIWWMIAAAAVAIPLHKMDFKNNPGFGYQEPTKAHPIEQPLQANA